MNRFKNWDSKAVMKLKDRIIGDVPEETIEKSKHKYGASPLEYNGVIYPSLFEASYAKELDFRKIAGDIKNWERQISFELVVNGVKICRIIVDFKIINNDGSIEYVETKGCETKDWKIKRKLFQALYPSIKYSVIKRS